MSTQQLVYEGTDLQALIQQVVDEHGPARIRPPDRRRKGGVFGFFAKEVYVISVDKEATEKASAAHPSTVGHSGAAAARTAAERRAALPGTLTDLIESTEDDLVLASSPAAAAPRPFGAGAEPVATDTIRAVKPFSQVLREVASSLGEEPGTYRPDPEKLRRITRLTPPPARTAEGTPTVEHERPTGEAAVVLVDLVAPVAPGGPGGPVAAAPSSPPPPATPARSHATPAAPVAPDPAPAGPELGGTLLGGTLLGGTLLGGTLLDVLLASGFPATLLAPAPQPAAGRSTVEAAFAGLAEAPPLPTTPGALVAVVGDARLVRPVARAVAVAVGCPATEIAVAAPRAGGRQHAPGLRATTPGEAASLAPGWRRHRAGVVAVHASPLSTDQRWTREVLRALKPSCIWAMASATTKTDDVRRFVDAVGGVDALGLSDVTATRTPAALLSLGIPVAWLDGEPATPSRWAAVVAGLMARS